MAQVVDVILKKLDESSDEAEIGQWMVQEGDKVSKDTPIVDIMIEKTEYEILAETDGVVFDIQKTDGEIVETGELLCRIRVE
jgi:pyruvate/2-oxoglutarate dehydrogenase complex dihydrolipoamide acyltransferase (E2) component